MRATCPMVKSTDHESSEEIKNRTADAMHLLCT